MVPTCFWCNHALKVGVFGCSSCRRSQPETKRNLKKIAKLSDMSEGKVVDAMVKTLAEVEGKQ